jgi:hypothetical protein
MSRFMAVLLLVSVPTLHASEPPAPNARYSAQESVPKTGSRLRENISSTSLYPLDRPWNRFTDEQKAKVRAFYEDMPVEDEPPFPLKGMQPVLQDLSRLLGAARAEGVVHLEMTVDPTGKTTAFKIYKMPDLDTAKYVAVVFKETKFKPAVCGGKPCQMDFPFRLRIVPD